MTSPFYTSPEQLVRDRSEYARRNIARGRDVVVMTFADGILFVGENSSTALHKISEIYDRIAFAGVGRYNEFDQLRRAGVQHADVKGYQFSREDVDARSLANLYAQYMGNVFTHEMKPLEVEILVAEVGSTPAGDQLFHILYDGSVVDEENFTVLGGEAEAIATRLTADYAQDLELGAALRLAASALAGPERSLAVAELEVAVLTRAAEHRAFRRVTDAADASETAEPETPAAPGPEPAAEAGSSSESDGAAGSPDPG